MSHLHIFSFIKMKHHFIPYFILHFILPFLHCFSLISPIFSLYTSTCYNHRNTQNTIVILFILIILRHSMQKMSKSKFAKIDIPRFFRRLFK